MRVQVPPFAYLYTKNTQTIIFSLYWEFKNSQGFYSVRCAGIAIAKTLDLTFIKQNLFSESYFFREVLYVPYRSADALVDFFLFPYGVIVRWGGDYEDEKHLLSMIEEAVLNRTEEERDDFIFIIGKKLNKERDDIVLPEDNLEIKLGFSHGIAQSVKLGVFEIQLQRLFRATQTIPEEMAAKGKIRQSRKEIRRLMGMLFLERSSINLSQDLLDQPEFFWERPDLEKYYVEITNNLDLKNRVNILNMRLGLIQEIFEILNTELNHQNTTMIEWTIVVLILIEVILVISKDFLPLLNMH